MEKASSLLIRERASTTVFERESDGRLSLMTDTPLLLRGPPIRSPPSLRSLDPSKQGEGNNEREKGPYNLSKGEGLYPFTKKKEKDGEERDGGEEK